MTSEAKPDVMVDVAPNITVFRQAGKWDFRAPPGVTKEYVVQELVFQAHRLGLKRDLLKEALEGLRGP